MRPIKFRVFDTKGKQYLDLETATIGIDPFNGRLFIYETESCESPIKAVDESRYILEQFTGLLDKNGREIYDGDILAPEHTPAKELRLYTMINDYNKAFIFVQYNDYRQKDTPWFKTYLLENHSIRVQSIKTYNLIVIGNIHENPELL